MKVVINPSQPVTGNQTRHNRVGEKPYSPGFTTPGESGEWPLGKPVAPSLQTRRIGRCLIAAGSGTHPAGVRLTCRQSVTGLSVVTGLTGCRQLCYGFRLFQPTSLIKPVTAAFSGQGG